MKFLPLPIDANDDVIIRQCEKTGWEARKLKWLLAAANYRHFHGDPWKIIPAGFSGEDADALYKLYDTQGRSGSINRIRRPKKSLPSCPMCGSQCSRSLDHALPRRYFPEFSILRENLVPACTSCNSVQKGATYRGEKDPERFIHPYYDQWASDALWRVQFGPDLDALEFRPVALPDLSSEHRCIVDFHVKSLLGSDWSDFVRREWSSLPMKLQRRLRPDLSIMTLKRELEIRLQDEIDTGGINSWGAGFLRGMLVDDAVIDNFIERIKNLPGGV